LGGEVSWGRSARSGSNLLRFPFDDRVGGGSPTRSVKPTNRSGWVILGWLATVGLGAGCSPASSGSEGSGGAAAASGGARGDGGASGRGGDLGSGGIAQVGGAGGMSASSGGRAATGGAPGTGGTGGTGGVPGTGGGSSGGAAGHGGASVGSGGAASGGAASGGSPAASSFCPGGTYPAVTLTGLAPTRISAVPPHDDFNLNGSAPLTIIEGPVWTGDALYVSELDYLTQAEAIRGTKPPPSRILKVTPAGDVTIAATDTGTNGMALDGAGGLLACDHKNGALTRFTLPALMPSVVVKGYMNARFDSPNDLVVAPDGNVYFSDPDYQAPQMRPQTATRLYRLAPGATEPTVIDESRRQPNGVTLSPRGDFLYLNSQDGIYRYPISAGGAVGAGAKFSQAVSSGDGIAIDCAGNLYIASGQAMVVLDSSGAQLGQIMVSGVQSVTNAAFGGADRKTLYITALGMGSSAGLFKVSLNIPGYPY